MDNTALFDIINEARCNNVFSGNSSISSIFPKKFVEEKIIIVPLKKAPFSSLINFYIMFLCKNRCLVCGKDFDCDTIYRKGD